MSSSTDAFLKRACTQTAVYWGTPAPDGYGGFTFADPVEIACRWQDKIETIKNDKGEEVISNATVFVLQDVSQNGYLFLGELTDLSSAEEADPRGIDNAKMILKFDKSPALKGDTYVRKVYL